MLRLKRKSLLTRIRESVRLEYGAFDPDRMPFCKEPLQVIDGARGKVFILLGSVQSVKTLILQFVALGTMYLRPRRALWFSTTLPALGDIVDDKLNPLFDSIPSLRRLLYADKDKRTRTKYIYREGSLLLRAGNIANNRNSKSAQDIYIDEPWMFDDGHLTEMMDRAGDYQDRSRVVMATSGPDAGGEVDEMTKVSDFREWHGRCPHCGNLFPFDWGDAESEHGMRWETSERTRNEDLSWNFRLVKETVEYVPSCCLKPIKFTPAIQRDINQDGEYVSINKNTDGKTITWHWNAMAHRDWRVMVVVWLIANTAKRRSSLELIENFKRKELAVAYSEVLEHKPKIEQVKKSGYNMLDTWSDEALDGRGKSFRSMKVDVQKDHFYISVRLHARDGRSRLYWCSKEHTFGNVKAKAAELGVSLHRTFMDSAWNKDTVLRYCANAGFLALNGVDVKRAFAHPDGTRKIYSEIELEDAFHGTIHEKKKVGKFLFGTLLARNRFELYRSMTAENGDPLWTLADDTPDWYREQVNNNVKIKKRHPRSGAWYFDYKQVGPDHANDLECMHVVYASMAGFLGTESMEQPEGDEKGE